MAHSCDATFCSAPQPSGSACPETVQPADATLLVLSGKALSDEVHSALMKAAMALGHAAGCSFAQTGDIADLALYVHARDPWAVVAVDTTAIEALGKAFDMTLAPDAPVQSCGYTLVAVPDFACCLDDQCAKRIAWNRLKAAIHPGNPLD